MPFHDDPETVFKRRMDKYPRKPFKGGQQIVGASADYYAVLLHGKLSYGIRLDGEQLVAHHHIVYTQRRDMTAVA